MRTYTIFMRISVVRKSITQQLNSELSYSEIILWSFRPKGRGFSHAGVPRGGEQAGQNIDTYEQKIDKNTHEQSR